MRSLCVTTPFEGRGVPFEQPALGVEAAPLPPVLLPAVTLVEPALEPPELVEPAAPPWVLFPPAAVVPPRAPEPPPVALELPPFEALPPVPLPPLALPPELAPPLATPPLAAPPWPGAPALSTPLAPPLETPPEPEFIAPAEAPPVPVSLVFAVSLQAERTRPQTSELKAVSRDMLTSSSNDACKLPTTRVGAEAQRVGAAREVCRPSQARRIAGAGHDRARAPDE